MDTFETAALLKSLVPPAERFVSEVGFRPGAAYLKIFFEAQPSDYAVVWTPGDRWFSLDVTGGFSYDYFEEGISDDDAKELLARLVIAAIAYIEGRRSRTLSRFLKIPAVRIEADDGPLELHLSLVSVAKRALRLNRT